MARDYSRFLPPHSVGGTPRLVSSVLQGLGWQPWFAQQTSVEELERTPPVRIVEIHRGGLHIQGDGLDQLIRPRADVTVGDWLLFDPDRPATSRLLDRKSLFKRRAPGTDRQVQLIAANVETAFVVSSCNHDFNLARLERYVALALEAGADPVLLLTKSDLCSDVERYTAGAAAISRAAPVVALNAVGDEPGAKLAAWCRPGQTVAFLGSSGVGKSTLANALLGRPVAVTRDIREDDSKGRHTTTRRQLHPLANGCMILDTPGMREIQLVDAEAGIAQLFAEIGALAERCRFSDCRHESEPGCAVHAALEAGEIDPERLARWRKLAREEQFNSASLAERRARERAFGRTVRAILEQQRKRRE